MPDQTRARHMALLFHVFVRKSDLNGGLLAHSFVVPPNGTTKLLRSTHTPPRRTLLRVRY